MSACPWEVYLQMQDHRFEALRKIVSVTRDSLPDLELLLHLTCQLASVASTERGFSVGSQNVPCVGRGSATAKQK